jgi:hypothetical protein
LLGDDRRHGVFLTGHRGGQRTDGTPRLLALARLTRPHRQTCGSQEQRLDGGQERVGELSQFRPEIWVLVNHVAVCLRVGS